MSVSPPEDAKRTEFLHTYSLCRGSGPLLGATSCQTLTLGLGPETGSAKEPG